MNRSKRGIGRGIESGKEREKGNENENDKGREKEMVNCVNVSANENVSGNGMTPKLLDGDRAQTSLHYLLPRFLILRVLGSATGTGIESPNGTAKEIGKGKGTVKGT
jgi:hypothetical protein